MENALTVKSDSPENRPDEKGGWTWSDTSDYPAGTQKYYGGYFGGNVHYENRNQMQPIYWADNRVDSYMLSGGWNQGSYAGGAMNVVIERNQTPERWFGNTTQKGENKSMIVTGMKEFENICKQKLVDWYNSGKNPIKNHQEITLEDVFTVWSCKALQNYKCLASTNVSGDGIYAEYTYNGDKQELYEDVYAKITNTCINE